ncbi:MAG: histidine phosphatase family protein [Pseudomonadales bacterium]
MAKLLLLRHAQIRANRQGRWHGSTDSALTWYGRRQVRRTARHIAVAHAPVTAVYTSPLARARSTAERIARGLGVPVDIHPDLREYAIGEWEGMRFSELAAQHRFVDVATRDLDFAPPGGETLRQVAERMVAAIRTIHDRHGDDDRVLVVGHGASMAVALGAFIDGDPARWVDYHFANCSLTELMLSPAPYVNFFNNTQHL